MKKHLGKRLFVTGIPTAGKSYLSRRLASEVGGISVSLDHHRQAISSDERYKKWIRFYSNKDEKEYFANTSPEEQWQNLVNQSEALWPAFLEKIDLYSEETSPVIFESVNLLPHIVKGDFDFSGIVLVGASYESVLERNMADPRWGNTKELQEMEAKYFFGVERPGYTKEAERFGYQVFESADEAYETARALLMGPFPKS